MKFIELTDAVSGTKIVINIDYIMYIHPAKMKYDNETAGANVFLHGKLNGYFVVERYEDITAMLMRKV